MLEQIKLFNQAKYIIADEGAALVNLMWCEENTKVGCIIPKEWNDYNYSTIANFSKVDCDYIAAKLVDDINHFLDPRIFKDYLIDLLSIGGQNDKEC